MTHRPLGLVLGILLVGGCSDSAGDKDGSVTGKLGTLRIKVDYSGQLTSEAKVVAALIGCPFVMPPKAFGDFPISASRMEGELPNIPPGDYCTTAFIDMVPGDGGSASGWVAAVDPAAVVDASDPPIKVTIEAGKTSDVTVTFNMKRTDAGVPDKRVKDSFVVADGTNPGPNDVWIDLTVNCPTCKTGGAFVFYGMLGPSLPVAMPEMYNKILNPTAWPLKLLLKSTAAPTALNLPKPFPAAEATFRGFHDANGMNYEGPDPDEPRSDPKTITLQKGALNKLTLDLKLP